MRQGQGQGQGQGAGSLRQRWEAASPARCVTPAAPTRAARSVPSSVASPCGPAGSRGLSCFLSASPDSDEPSLRISPPCSETKPPAWPRHSHLVCVERALHSRTRHDRDSGQGRTEAETEDGGVGARGRAWESCDGGAGESAPWRRRTSGPSVTVTVHPCDPNALRKGRSSHCVSEHRLARTE